MLRKELIQIVIVLHLCKGLGQGRDQSGAVHGGAGADNSPPRADGFGWTYGFTTSQSFLGRPNARADVGIGPYGAVKAQANRCKRGRPGASAPTQNAGNRKRTAELSAVLFFIFL